MKRKLSGLVKFARFISGYPLRGHYTPPKKKYDWDPVIQAVTNYINSTGANTSHAGPTLDRIVHLVSGGPYAQPNFKPGDSQNLVIGVGGYGEGEGGPSYRYFDWLKNKPNAIYLRHDDTKYLKEILDAARQSKIPTAVLGHSFGASSLVNIADKYPEVFFMASDPVSRFNFKKDSVSDNLMYHMPIKITPTEWAGGNIISVLGGRWHPPFDHTLYYNDDGHTSGVADRELEQLYTGVKRWLDRGVTASQIKKNMQKNVEHRRKYPLPETSKEYYDAHSFNGNIPPEGWQVPDVSGTPQMPNVFGEQ